MAISPPTMLGPKNQSSMPDIFKVFKNFYFSTVGINKDAQHLCLLEGDKMMMRARTDCCLRGQAGHTE